MIRHFLLGVFFFSTFANANGRLCTEGCLDGQSCIANVTLQPACTIATCVECPPGTYTTIPGHPCKLCGAGDYQPNSGATSCIRCPGGTEPNVANATAGGATSCRLCPDGTRRWPGVTTTCEPCARGFIGSGVGATECNKCPAGKTSSGEINSTCFPCPEGTFAEKPG